MERLVLFCQLTKFLFAAAAFFNESGMSKNLKTESRTLQKNYRGKKWEKAEIFIRRIFERKRNPNSEN